MIQYNREMPASFNEMKEFLEDRYLQYDTPEFIEHDPISIPHKYESRLDIEVVAFVTAAISWGRRDLILRSANNLCNFMGNNPYDFIMSASEERLDKMNGAVYRTFNSDDLKCFVMGLRHIYSTYESLEDVIVKGMRGDHSIREGLSLMRDMFFEIPHHHRSEKHFADVTNGAAGKRLNMFLRWMIRQDDRGVDFGLWRRIPTSKLYIPLDLHSGNTARMLGLLTRKANDWRAVEELTSTLRTFDPNDPVKYDYALFGYGVNNGK